MHLSPAQLSERFGDLFAESTFRLELLDYYVADNEVEPLRRFRAGKSPDPAWREPWKRLVREALASGRRMERVHVVTEPLSEYLRFELTCAYPANVEAGEDVRVLPRRVTSGLDLPDRDYWLFDSRTAGLMSYDAAGNFLDIELTDDPDVVGRCIEGRDIAMRHAVPLLTYVTTEKIEEIPHESRRAS